MPGVIVWRMRADEGLDLQPLLSTLCPGQAWISEPFGAGAAQHSLAVDWGDPYQRSALAERLSNWLAPGRWISHSVGDADADPEFHQGLIQTANLLGYRHLVLYWRHGLPRLAGQAPAAALHDTAQSDINASLHRLLRTDRRALQMLGRIRQTLLQGGACHVAAFDDLLPGAAEGSLLNPARWGELQAFFGADAITGEQHLELARALDKGREAMLALPPDLVELLRQEAEWTANLDMAPGFLRAQVSLHQGPSGAVRAIRLGALPARLCEGDKLRLAGAVVVDGDLSDARLVLRQSQRHQRLHWGLDSPGLAAQFPQLPGAATARFRQTQLVAKAHQPAELLVRRGAEQLPVAEIDFVADGRATISGIHLARASIGYQPIPKVACTSIKEALFKLVAGAHYAARLGAGDAHVHRYFDLRTQDITNADWRFLVVRDPIKRFLSGFSNRVLHHKELSPEYVSRLKLEPALDMAGFPFNPDIDTFVENFALYRRVPTIDHHFRPISEFVAPLEAFDSVYPFEQLDRLSLDMTERLGRPFVLPHSQRGGPKLSVRELKPATLAKLKKIYASDYKLLAAWYSPDALR